MSKEKQNTPVTLESLEEHLKQQDKDDKSTIMMSAWLAMIFVGFSTVIAGIVQALNYSGATIIVYGAVLIVVAVVIIFIQKVK